MYNCFWDYSHSVQKQCINQRHMPFLRNSYVWLKSKLGLLWYTPMFQSVNRLCSLWSLVHRLHCTELRKMHKHLRFEVGRKYSYRCHTWPYIPVTCRVWDTWHPSTRVMGENQWRLFSGPAPIMSPVYSLCLHYSVGAMFKTLMVLR